MRIAITPSLRGLMLCAGAWLGAVALTGAPAVARSSGSAITEAEVNAAQKAWCAALVEIGHVYEEGGDYKNVASQRIDEIYDYQGGRVFFKPTKASGATTFRPTKAGALAYFVGGDPNFPDKGFALEPWRTVEYDNSAAPNGIQIHGNLAITMGFVYLTNSAGIKVAVDKTFVFRKDARGKLRLIAHHSSLPFEPVP